VAGCTSANSGSDGGEDTLSGDIEISGSSTVFPLAEAVAEKFMTQHEEVNISVKSTGSGGGFKNHFCPGRSDFNNASRQIKDSETQQCQDNDIEAHEIKVATDALTVVVNNEADWVDCITVDELKQIWKPDPATKWSEVRDGWPDEPIDRYGAAETSGTFDYFTEVVVGEEGAHTSDYQPTEKDNLIVQGVTGNKYAIGYFGFSYYYNNPDQVTALKVDDGSGCVGPSLETAKGGEYTPLARPLFTYASESALAEEHVAEFARFYVEESANQQLVAEEVGYVPNSEEEMQAQLDALNDVIDSAQG
jgi:phosphate transport system substrate-binding protein